MTVSPIDFRLAYAFADNAPAELDRCLYLLLSTREGTMPLNREFGVNMDYLDKPAAVAKSLYTAEVTKKVAAFVPSVRVREVTWSVGDAQNLIPRVVITGV